jgi:putative transposase
LGLLLAVIVLPANVQDRDGAKTLFMYATEMLTTIKTIWADGAYAGQLIEWVSVWCGWTLEIVKRLKDVAGFVPLRKRWIVERTIAWLNLSRRLSKDYEYLEPSSEAMVRISAVRFMLHRRFRPRRARRRRNAKKLIAASS